ncbi:N-acetyltransferase family protein [Hymenobacter oligotrophus]|uniref:N-acetyltransferase family protein n=1 Tax=Hymenobacter oligotrophus TaxID=2319843 RepID=A0A3B7R0N7_9BACT|nr:GNAT family N-acetyltransferase [Hymenobacter oligotrophus]AYA36920.1 N-acetyltransferase family protein [Hymenobacter oligotrophus]
MTLHPLTEQHWPAVQAIYAAGVGTGNATFETQVPAWPTWHASHLGHSRLVACNEQQQVVGWAALSPVSGRCVYGGVAEVSVYVAAEARGQGVGLLLLRALVQASESNGIWTLQAGILPENTASLALHAKAGFRVVGYRERLGQLHGVWRNVVLLERRSAVVGTAGADAPASAAAPTRI